MPEMDQVGANLSKQDTGHSVMPALPETRWRGRGRQWGARHKKARAVRGLL